MVFKKFIFWSGVCLTALFVCGFYFIGAEFGLAKTSDICHMGTIGSSQDACFDCQKNASTTACSCKYVGENVSCGNGSGQGRCLNGLCFVCKEAGNVCNFDSDCCGTLGCLNKVCSADRPSVAVPVVPSLSKETNCCDSIDNDGDGLADSQDSDCLQIKCEQKIPVSIIILDKNNNQPIMGIKVEMVKAPDDLPIFSCQTDQAGVCSIEVPIGNKYSIKPNLNSADFRLESYSIDNQKVLAPSSSFEIFVSGNKLNLKIFVKDLRAAKCSLCGQGFFNTCDERECVSFGECAFQKKLVGGSCLPKDLAGFCECPSVYQPVCGRDGLTYQNSCQIQCLKKEKDYDGECQAQTAVVVNKEIDCSQEYGANYLCLDNVFWQNYCSGKGNKISLENKGYCLDKNGVKRNVCARCGTEDYFVFELKPGWNTISFPLMPSPSNLAKVFAPIAGSIGSLKTFDNTAKKQIDLANCYNGYGACLYSAVLGQGYLVFIKGDKNVNLEISGQKNKTLSIQDFLGFFNLSKGTNLIGFPFLYPIAIGDVNFVDQCSLITYFTSGDLSNPLNQTRALFYDCQKHSGSLAEFEPGKAYWLEVSQEKFVKVKFKVVLLNNADQKSDSSVAGVAVKVDGLGFDCITDNLGFCSLLLEPNVQYQAIAQKEDYTCNLQGICWQSFVPKDLTGDKVVVLALKKKTIALPEEKNYLSSCSDAGILDIYTQGFARLVEYLRMGTIVSKRVNEKSDTCASGKLIEYFCQDTSIGQGIGFRDEICLFGCGSDEGTCQRPSRLASFSLTNQANKQPITGVKVEIFPRTSLKKIAECQTNNQGTCFVSLSEQNQYSAFVSGEGYQCSDNATILGCEKDFEIQQGSIVVAIAMAKSGQEFCFDSDNGSNMDVKGVVENQKERKEDICLAEGEGKILQEYSCSANNTIESANLTCPGKCQDGQCQAVSPSLGLVKFNVLDKNLQVSGTSVKHTVWRTAVVSGALVKVKYSQNNQAVGSCLTDSKGVCQMNLEKGKKYFAYAEKDGKVCSGCLKEFDLSTNSASLTVGLQFLSIAVEPISQTIFASTSAGVIIPPVSTSTLPVINYCSNCGIGILNLCRQVECWSLGDCLYIKKFIGGACMEKSKCMCPEIGDLVCGSDGQTYANACLAGCAKVKVSRSGSCSATPLPTKLMDCKKEIKNVYFCSSYEKWQKDCKSKGEAIQQDVACNVNGDKYCSTCHQCPNGDIDCSTSMDYIKGKTAKCDMAKGECYYQEDKCVDSDNGKNYFQVGTTSVGGLTFTDYCTSNNLTYESLLHEGYCENNQFKEETHPCITECRLGACVAGNVVQPTQAKIIQISAGAGHTCALLSDKMVECWGLNDFGQLGDGTKNNSSLPVFVKNLENVVEISAGGWHTCARMFDGKVKCWGLNEYGALGNDTNVDSVLSVDVIGIANAIQLDAGCRHPCATLADGKVKCWGSNDYGKLGDGTNTNRNIPVEVKGIVNAQQVSPKTNSTCVVLKDGKVECWGRGEKGQLGNGVKSNSFLPVFVSGISNAVEVAVGNIHSCVRLQDESVKCWGDNFYGQLGNGVINDKTPISDRNGIMGESLIPISVINIKGAKEIKVGNWHSCAKLFDGTVKCWGRNNVLDRETLGGGLLGDGRNGLLLEISNTPVQVKNLGGVVQIVVGDWHACALLEGGVVKCWGSDEYGQLGDGKNIDTALPVLVSDSSVKNTLSSQSAVSIEAGGTVELSNGQGKARLVVPIGAVKEPATVKILLKPASDSNGGGAAISSGQNIMGGYVYDFTMVNQAGNEITTFDKPIKVEIYYTDEQVAGVSENDLTIRYYDEAQQKWVVLSTQVDAVNNILRAEMSSFGTSEEANNEIFHQDIIDEVFDRELVNCQKKYGKQDQKYQCNSYAYMDELCGKGKASVIQLSAGQVCDSAEHNVCFTCPAISAINYCSNCGKGIFNLCQESECLSSGDCLFIKKLVGGTCVEKSKCACPETGDLVCGSDGENYPNACLAECVGIKISHNGSCEATSAPNEIIDCKKEISNLYWCSDDKKWQDDCHSKDGSIKGKTILQKIPCNANGDRYCSTCHQCPNGDVDCATSMEVVPGKTTKCDMAKGKCYYQESQCVDSDSGKNYFQSGNTSVGGTILTDYCAGNNLYEGYCENNEAKREIYSCVSGCEIGACLETKVCSDGSINMKCSSNKPLYCQNLKLVEDCVSCGCPKGMICQKDSNQCVQANLGNKIDILNNGSPEEKIDILFIPLHAPIPSSFGSVIDNFILNKLKKYQVGFFDVEPFKSNQQRFNLAFVDKILDDQEYSCDFSGHLSCNYEKILNDYKEMFNVDFIVLLNQTGSGGTARGGIIYVGLDNLEYDSNYQLPRVFIHEFAHLFAGLDDEYNMDGSWDTQNIDKYFFSASPNLDYIGCPKWCESFDLKKDKLFSDALSYCSQAKTKDECDDLRLAKRNAWCWWSEAIIPGLDVNCITSSFEGRVNIGINCRDNIECIFGGVFFPFAWHGGKSIMEGSQAAESFNKPSLEAINNILNCCYPRSNNEYCQKLRLSFSLSTLDIATSYKSDLMTCSSSKVCYDSDNGKNSEQAGYVVKNDRFVVDRCFSSTDFMLNEAYCKEGEIASFTMNCPNGCKDGACIK